MLLDKIGPAIIVTHSAGGPFGWLVAEARPNLVKGIIAIEGGGQPFAGANVWGMSTIPVAYDPPVLDSSELKTVTVSSPEKGVADYKIQAEPARKLINLQGIPIVMVTSEGSFASPGNPGAVAFFKQAGCTAEELRLVDHGIHGNGHMMMVEKNNRQVLQPILDWIAKNVEKDAVIPGPRLSESALKLADQGFFWVGAEHKKMPYGTILAGQMYVQYLVPAQVRHPYPGCFGPRRNRPDAALHGRRRRASRLGALLRASGIPGVSGGPPRPRARAVSSRRAWADWPAADLRYDRSRFAPLSSMGGQRTNWRSIGRPADGEPERRASGQRDGTSLLGQPRRRNFSTKSARPSCKSTPREGRSAGSLQTNARIW